jgi:hypothetical protein
VPDLLALAVVGADVGACIVACLVASCVGTIWCKRWRRRPVTTGPSLTRLRQDNADLVQALPKDDAWRTRPTNKASLR